MNAEQKRVQENSESQVWSQWGPYLSERQWGTVREDYSPDGNAWDYFPHDHARSRVYRWGEDGLGGFCDAAGEICFALAFWNGQDSILKERLFGLTNAQGNHGEDVKEYYFYVDNTPSHSYMRWVYKYPQQAYPYTELVNVNAARTRQEGEYELIDTGIFNDDRYFDITAEYAKATPDDICIRIHIVNRGKETAEIDVLPTLWFRNTWSWTASKPTQKLTATNGGIKLYHPNYGDYWLYCDRISGKSPSLLFTENETNFKRLFGGENPTAYVKDAFHTYLIQGQPEAVNPDQMGTKSAAHYHLTLTGGEQVTLQLRFTHQLLETAFGSEFTATFSQRQQEADQFYTNLFSGLTEDDRTIQRQAFAALLWSKQFYNYDVHTWLQGDSGEPSPPAERLTGRNKEWQTFYSKAVISMPDKWEYPWFAAWDWSFHCVVFALIDPGFAKQQLLLLCSDQFISLQGQIPAYEWCFSDVNPPVQAWAAWKVYQYEKQKTGQGDRNFLEQMFQMLQANYYWWLNREDKDQKNLFQGGFLGLDNITIFNRSAALPTGGYLQQSDGTAWMGMFSLNMMIIALELGHSDPVYRQTALSFLRHFLNIAQAMDRVGGDHHLSLWDETAGFFFSALTLPDGQEISLKIYSLVGLAPLLAVCTLEPEVLEQFPDFQAGMEKLIQRRPDLIQHIASLKLKGKSERRLAAIATPEELKRILKHLLDESEFLSPYGIRSVSQYHRQHPYHLNNQGHDYVIDYEPAESTTGEFGGNSNWRGPIWFPMNYLLIESMQRYYRYLGDDFRVECPTGSGNLMTLKEVAEELSQRLINLFRKGAEGRPIYGDIPQFQHDPHWRDLLRFHEYFQGDNGIGLGASQQAGWTALVAKLIQEVNDKAFYDQLGQMLLF
ncbi:MGH1-like glycoside hydrolase domain-containing protein [Planktothrix mougeotii]|uniref:Glucosidase n=1 Tax=Planktothrix mougeotii LEGE 06226 TaxID=1828728 RepID=A0ABR9UB78_9CYAN|nr:glucosidase [Planktothrix mougeotii]MBE9143441.1 glucosidase [Planktothrix mougeotii LEGE 06226]